MELVRDIEDGTDHRDGQHMVRNTINERGALVREGGQVWGNKSLPLPNISWAGAGW